MKRYLRATKDYAVPGEILKRDGVEQKCMDCDEKFRWGEDEVTHYCGCGSILDPYYKWMIREKIDTVTDPELKEALLEMSQFVPDISRKYERFVKKGDAYTTEKTDYKGRPIKEWIAKL